MAVHTGTDPAPLHGVHQALIIRPGDTLLLRIAVRLTDEEVTRLRQELAGMLPDVTPIFIEGVEEMAIYRPTDKTKAP